jgi:ribosomal-protein-alanine N-acetyltransferase
VKTPDLETARLHLRRLAIEDAGQVQRIFPQWDIVQHMTPSIPWPYPEDGSLIYIRDYALPAMDKGQEYHWSLRPKAQPERLIGMIALKFLSDENRGFWLDPLWQGQGLMREACDIVTDFWFDTLGQPVLRVPKAVANLRSRAFSEHSGMRVIWRGERDYVSGPLESELWEMTASEWRNHRSKS